MKKIFVLTIFLFLLVSTSFAKAEIGPFVFDGYLKGYFFPPHNEYDPNPGVPFVDRNTARYGLELNNYLSFSKFPKFYFLTDIMGLFGNTKPQTDYNYSAKPIVAIINLGIGYHVTNHFDVGIEHSRHVDLGGYTLNERLLWTAITAQYNW